MLRIPDHALDCVMFLAVEDDRGHLLYGGTAFIVSVPLVAERYAPYLVTARHNIEMARRAGGRLVARFNRAGGADLIDLSRVEVIEPEDPGSDVAVIADLDWDQIIGGGAMRHLALPEMAASTTFVNENDIGIGTEVFATGLFAARRGEGRNLPVGRTGTISAMPLELDEDEWSGEPYLAYLVEMRSLGGLSGSPVYVMTPPKLVRLENEGGGWYLDQQLRLLGVIRGHWNYRPESTAVDFDQAEGDLVHSGIAITTPVDVLLDLLERADMKADRARRVGAR